MRIKIQIPKVLKTYGEYFFVDFSELWNSSYLVCSASKRRSLKTVLCLGAGPYELLCVPVLPSCISLKGKRNQKKILLNSLNDTFTVLWEFLKTPWVLLKFAIDTHSVHIIRSSLFHSWSFTYTIIACWKHHTLGFLCSKFGLGHRSNWINSTKTYVWKVQSLSASKLKHMLWL